MTHVVTLVSNSARPVLDDEILHIAARCLPAAQPPQWLDHPIAADIRFTPASVDDDRATDTRLREALAGIPIDFILQTVATRRKKLFVADMDSTMIEQECIDELADFVGLKARVAAITERAMLGEIAFEPALRERVALLRGLSADVITKVIGERITTTPGARTLIQTMRARGTFTALVSGGFTLFSREIAAMIGFDTYRGNVLIIENGRLTGHVKEPIFGKSAKREALEFFRATQGIAASETLAVGDGANDLDMLLQAGLGIAFHAKPAVAAAAHARIDHADLTALLYAQGYRRAEFQQ
ncbi:phosphoserine phosphatase SerB [Methylovirgula sp. HY1]|uniref:phosphoserine phosphatase SerB n=1 Tax=Methylovirgula sp. HY1 TaxID=2822761 RepID=UPI001C5BDC59|nr:phosphoserine phosphatase SerB [Methylovirgula sp. HY1]QXX74493.1 Phosphoserine phosphatase [Methylovirgula sp. HY1]